MSNIYETGFCWRCGKVIKIGLFCPKPKKCGDVWVRQQEAKIRKGKRAGYGLAGSTH